MAPRHHNKFREAHGPPESHLSGTSLRPCHSCGRPAHSAIMIVWEVPSMMSFRPLAALIGKTPS